MNEEQRTRRDTTTGNKRPSFISTPPHLLPARALGRSAEIPYIMQIQRILAVICMLTLSASAQEDVKPLHLAVSKVGNKMVLYNKGEELHFTMTAEIADCLNFSLNGEFTKAKIEKATVVAPDGKSYELVIFGEQPPASKGNWMQFLWIRFGDAHTGFSIGNWKVKIKFQVDGVSYDHEADYLITWRKPDDGIWGNQSWANESEKKAEQVMPPNEP